LPPPEPPEPPDLSKSLEKSPSGDAPSFQFTEGFASELTEDDYTELEKFWGVGEKGMGSFAESNNWFIEGGDGTLTMDVYHDDHTHEGQQPHIHRLDLSESSVLDSETLGKAKSAFDSENKGNPGAFSPESYKGPTESE